MGAGVIRGQRLLLIVAALAAAGHFGRAAGRDLHERSIGALETGGPAPRIELGRQNGWPRSANMTERRSMT